MNKEKKYQHITKSERLEIALLKEKRYSIRDIARVLNRSPGTISDEIRRNSVSASYDPSKANHKAYIARKYSKYQGMKVVQRPALRDYWEGDFIVSGRNGSGVLLVLHERKARYAIIRKIMSPSIKAVHQYLSEITGGVVMNTLTLDNDILFRRHREMSRILGVPVYFCHPYHSWEKGGVENTNKLIRRYVPKGSDISQLSDAHICAVQEKLNTRPRKCLGYRTPAEVMDTHHQFTISPLRENSDTITHIDINKKADCSA